MIARAIICLSSWLLVACSASALELAGQTIEARASAETRYVTGAVYVNDFYLWVYFGSEGTRFVYLDKAGEGVVLPKGQDRGQVRMGKFAWTVTLEEKSSSLEVDAVGKTSTGSRIELSYRIAVSSRGCKLTSFSHRVPVVDGKRNTVVERDIGILGKCLVTDGRP